MGKVSLGRQEEVATVAYRLSAFFVLGTAAYHLLIRVYPIFWDGGGPMPSFYYPGYLPTIKEYFAAKDFYDFYFRVPYVIASTLAVLILMMVYAKTIRRRNRTASQIFLFAGGWSVCALMGMAVLNDFSAAIGISGGYFLLHSGAILGAGMLMQVVLPLAMLNGAMAAVEMAILPSELKRF